MSSPPPIALLESIRLEDGRLPLLEYHQQRVDRSRKRLLARAPSLKLAAELQKHDLPRTGLFKVRVVYGHRIQSVDVRPYTIRPVHSLCVLPAPDLRYEKKYADRSGIQELFAQRGAADDVIMTQHGYLTDSSYANLALFDGRRWYTPAAPMLRGTRRASLLADGILEPTLIRVRDLPRFEKIRLVNAMMEWEEGPEIPLSAVDYSLPGQGARS